MSASAYTSYSSIYLHFTRLLDDLDRSLYKAYHENAKLQEDCEALFSLGQHPLFPIRTQEIQKVCLDLLQQTNAWNTVLHKQKVALCNQINDFTSRKDASFFWEEMRSLSTKMHDLMKCYQKIIWPNLFEWIAYYKRSMDPLFFFDREDACYEQAQWNGIRLKECLEHVQGQIAKAVCSLSTSYALQDN